MSESSERHEWFTIFQWETLLKICSDGYNGRKRNRPGPEKEDLFARKCSPRSNVDESEADKENRIGSKSKRLRRKPSKYADYKLYWVKNVQNNKSLIR